MYATLIARFKVVPIALLPLALVLLQGCAAEGAAADTAEPTSSPAPTWSKWPWVRTIDRGAVPVPKRFSAVSKRGPQSNQGEHRGDDGERPHPCAFLCHGRDSKS
jgi:hypothetical protein